MKLHAYCIRRAGEPPPEPGLRGVGGVPVTSLSEGELALWVSVVESSPAATDPTAPEALRLHDQVVRVALRSATPLPFRFGTGFADEAAARALLRERWAEFHEVLGRVANRVEIGVTLLWDAGAEEARLQAEHPELRVTVGEPTSGRDYLERRRRATALETALRARAEVLLESIEEALGPELPTVRTLLPRRGAAGTLAQLVPRSALGEYRRRCERVREAAEGVRVALSGPWAPYSFV